MQRGQQTSKSVPERSGALFYCIKGLCVETYLLALFNYLDPQSAQLNAAFDFDVASGDSKSDA